MRRFRLANLQLQELGRCDSVAAIHVALETLPSDLNSLYNRALSQVPELYRRGVGQLLQFLLYSGVDIDKDSALDIMAVNSDCLHLHRSFKQENLMRSLRSISPIFSCLILERSSKVPHESAKIDIAHSSVKDFLEGGAQVEAFDTQFTSQEGRLDVIRVVSRYLLSVPSVFQEEQERKSRPGKTPSLRHGLRALVRKIFEETFPSDSIENDLQDVLFQLFSNMTDSSMFPDHIALKGRPALERHRKTKPDAMEYGHSPNSGLIHACALKACAGFGLINTLKLLLRHGSDLNGAFSPQSTPPLIAACCNWDSCEEIPKLLLDEGADPNVSGGRKHESALIGVIQSAFYHDTYSGTTQDLEKAETLYQKGAKIDLIAPGKWGHTVLFRLCLHQLDLRWDDHSKKYRRYDTRVVKAVLDWGADPNFRAICVELETLKDNVPRASPSGAPEEYLTPLELVLDHGTTEILRWLLEKGAIIPPNSDRDRIYWSFIYSKCAGEPALQNIVFDLLKLSPEAQVFYSRVWPLRDNRAYFLRAAISAKDHVAKTGASSWDVGLFNIPNDKDKYWLSPEYDRKFLILAFEWTYLEDADIMDEATLTVELDANGLSNLLDLGPNAWDDEISPILKRSQDVLEEVSTPGTLIWAMEQSLKLDVPIEIHLRLSPTAQVFRFRRTVNIERQLYDPSEHYLNKPILAHCRNQIIKKWTHHTGALPFALRDLQNELERPLHSQENDWTDPEPLQILKRHLDINMMSEVQQTRLFNYQSTVPDQEVTIRAWGGFKR